jgi:hypothetical protein
MRTKLMHSPIDFAEFRKKKRMHRPAFLQYRGTHKETQKKNWLRPSLIPFRVAVGVRSDEDPSRDLEKFLEKN